MTRTRPGLRGMRERSEMKEWFKITWALMGIAVLAITIVITVAVTWKLAGALITDLMRLGGLR